MINSKKLIIFLLISILFVGCSKNNLSYKPPEDNKVSAKDNNKKENKDKLNGVTTNKINFQVITDAELPENVANSIKTMKANRGFIGCDYNGDYYISVFSGEKNTGGYNIMVLSVEDNEGKTTVKVEETSPAKSNITTQVITYPNITIKISEATSNIIIENSKGENFPRILKDGEIY